MTMNTSEMLRKLADIIDRMQISTGADHQSEPNQPAANLVPVDIVHTDTSDPTAMVSPLQQKIELYKQGADLDIASQQPSAAHIEIVKAPVEIGASSSEPEEEQATECGDDEMDIMRRNAGLPPTTSLMIARED